MVKWNGTLDESTAKAVETYWSQHPSSFKQEREFLIKRSLLCSLECLIQVVKKVVHYLS